MNNISKEYILKDKKSFFALKNVNLSFNDSGLVGIIGKSGSGKSTLLNLICKIDEPTSGEIIYKSNRYRNTKKNYQFFNREIGIVFQSYNLIEDETVLFNVCLPLFMSGHSKKAAKKIASETLKSVGINESLFNKKANLLSGGERQRVGIARAIVNKPRIILCDEPTGALDTDNSIKIMEILRDISKTALVIVVSHNLQLIEKYSDRIIEISDGKVINDVVKRSTNSINCKQSKNKRRNTSWISTISSNNYKKRLKRNIVSSLAFTTTLSLLYLVIGFISGKDIAIKNACLKQFDFGAGSISKEEKMGGQGLLTLSKSVRPELSLLTSNIEISKKYEICLNFNAIFPLNNEISYQEKMIDDLIFTPIYSFNKPFINYELMLLGSLPIRDNLSELVVNETAFNYLKKELGKSPLYETFNYDQDTITTYIDSDDTYINDLFSIHQSFKIVGVIKEINYMSAPKIYYSYSALEEYMKESVLSNISTYFDKQITWYDRVYEAENYSALSSYSYYLFLKDYHLGKEIIENRNIYKELTFTSQSLLLTDSLLSFFEVAQYGVILFMVITFIGSILILSIMSFTSYSEDHKVSAILTALGAKNSEIQDIYLEESLLNGIISFSLSTCLAIGLSRLINLLISKFIDLESVIAIPIKSFLGISYSLPLLVFIFIFLVVCFSTLIPIAFSKKNSIRGELQSL